MIVVPALGELGDELRIVKLDVDGFRDCSTRLEPGKLEVNGIDVRVLCTREVAEEIGEMLVEIEEFGVEDDSMLAEVRFPTRQDFSADLGVCGARPAYLE